MKGKSQLETTTTSIADITKYMESHAGNAKIENPVLLETGQVIMQNDSQKCNANVLIDRGSKLSYITQDIAKVLQLKPKYRRSMKVNGFGGHSTRKFYDIANVGVITTE